MRVPGDDEGCRTLQASLGQSRRQALSRLGAGLAGAALAAAAGPTLFTASCSGGRRALGPARDLRQGFNRVADAELIVVREGDALRAMSLRCTHQRCIVDIVRTGIEAGKFELHCPCHAGKYDAEGIPYAGPPPAPLQHFELTVDESGQIWVDTSIFVDPAWRLEL